MILAAAATFSAHSENAKPESRWAVKFRRELKLLEAEHPGQVGVFVRDLRRGDVVASRAGEKWYLASGVKLVVAAEILRQAEAGLLSLDEKITLTEDDYVDGAGTLNYAPPGSVHTVRHLLEQMMILSDNTASDLLIAKAGLDNVNSLAKKFKLGKLTSLAEVRRKVYGHLHPSAARLKSKDYLALYMAPSDGERAALLEKLIKVPPAQWNYPSVEKAYAAYYAEKVNSATLESYTAFMDKILNGAVLKPETARVLLEIMLRCKTGEKRVKAALPPGLAFAHKTGTQRKRVCDFGVVRGPDGANLALVSVCARGLTTVTDAEKLLAAVSSALTASGIYNLGPDPEN